MRVNYIPICYRYGLKQLLVVSASNAVVDDLGYKHLALGVAMGILAAIAGVYPAQRILKKFHAHPAKGSILLRRLQYACVAAGIYVGALTEYKTHRPIQPPKSHPASFLAINQTI